jgi:Putative amidase domain
MKKIKIFGLALLITGLFVIGGCEEVTLDKKSSPSVVFDSQLESQVAEVVNSFMNEGGEYLVSKKEPKFEMLTNSGVAKQMMRKVFTDEKYSFSEYEAQVTKVEVLQSGNLIKGKVFYHEKKKNSVSDKIKYREENDYSEDVNWLNVRLIRDSSGVLKLEYIDIRTMGEDMSPEELKVNDEFTGSDNDYLKTQALNQKNARQLSFAYNRDDAASYARSYTINNNETDCNGYNDAYHCFKRNDCANFVSQCIHEAGIPMTNSFNSPSSYDVSWWSDNSQPDKALADKKTSGSWRSAHNLRRYLLNSGKAIKVDHPSKLQKGDIVFASWVINDSGDQCESGCTCSMPNDWYDHAMLVTKVRTNWITGKYEDLELTYHTNDRKDKLLSAVIQQSSFDAGVCLNFPANYTVPPKMSYIRINNEWHKALI